MNTVEIKAVSKLCGNHRSQVLNPHISPVSATAFQVLPWLRYVSARDPQRVKNTSAVTDLTCLATKGPCHERIGLSYIGNKGNAVKDY